MSDALTDGLTPDDIQRAAARNRDRLAAELFIYTVALAARTDPDAVRHALAEVFDLAAVEENIRRVMDAMRGCWKAAKTVERRLQDLENMVQRIEDQIDGLHFRVDQRNAARAAANPNRKVQR